MNENYPPRCGGHSIPLGRNIKSGWEAMIDAKAPPPALSVTVLNYNYGRFLGRCLDSILAQSFDDFEVIVIDDCSSDGSLDVLRRYIANPRVRAVAHATNAGFAASLIEGTEVHSRGRYVTVVSADDELASPEAFGQLIAPLETAPHAALAFGAFRREGLCISEIHRSFQTDQILARDAAFAHFLFDPRVWACHSGTIIRKSAYSDCGGYRRDITMPLDLALYLDCSTKYGLCYVDEVTVTYHVHQNQMSGARFAARLRNEREVISAIRQAGAAARKEGLEITSADEDSAIAGHLGRTAIYDAFATGRRAAFVQCAAALVVRKHRAVASPLWQIALTRAVLGARTFDILRATKRKLISLPGKV